MVCLSESKAKVKKIKRLNRKLRYKNVKFIEYVGISGGLCIFWDDLVSLNITELSQDYIDGYIFDNASGTLWRFTFVYGNPDFDLRQAQWQRLALSVGNSDMPWLCLGNFNDILFNHEKEGMKLKANRNIKGFKCFVDNCSFLELECNDANSHGPITESKAYWLKKKLDRVLANYAWLVCFPNAWQKLFLPHVPTIVRLFFLFFPDL